MTNVIPAWPSDTAGLRVSWSVRTRRFGMAPSVRKAGGVRRRGVQWPRHAQFRAVSSRCRWPLRACRTRRRRGACP